MINKAGWGGETHPFKIMLIDLLILWIITVGLKMLFKD